MSIEMVDGPAEPAEGAARVALRAPEAAVASSRRSAAAFFILLGIVQAGWTAALVLLCVRALT